jgi:hypothetical protein
MKLPNTPLTVVPNGGDVPQSAEPGVTSALSAQDAPLLDVSHVDYNRHPLKVAGLDHFIEQPEGSERFRIS